MKSLAKWVALLTPLAIAALEHERALSAQSETVEVARVLSQACLASQGVAP